MTRLGPAATRLKEAYSRFRFWILPLFAVEVAVSILYRADHPWVAPAMGIFSVMLGTVLGARLRAGSPQRPVAWVAEVSAAELSALQDAAIARGLRSIGNASVGSIGSRLSRDRGHFLVLPSRRRRKGQGALTVRCMVLLRLRDDTARVGCVEVDSAVFDGLAQVDDAVRVNEIVKQLGQARVFTANRD